MLGGKWWVKEMSRWGNAGSLLFSSTTIYAAFCRLVSPLVHHRCPLNSFGVPIAGPSAPRKADAKSARAQGQRGSSPVQPSVPGRQARTAAWQRGNHDWLAELTVAIVSSDDEGGSR